MRQFNNLYEAHSYQLTCPLCKKQLTPSWDERIVEFDEDPIDSLKKSKYGIFSTEYRTIVVCSHGDNRFKINYVSNKIEEYTETRSLNQTYSIGSIIPISHGSYYNLSFSEIILNFTCRECSGYEYSVKSHFSITDRRIFDIVLLSEKLRIFGDESNIEHEIFNNYVFEKTNFLSFNKQLSQYHLPIKNVDLPLIPLNLKEPEKNLERIKKLIPFL